MKTLTPHVVKYHETLIAHEDINPPCGEMIRAHIQKVIHDVGQQSLHYQVLPLGVDDHVASPLTQMVPTGQFPPTVPITRVLLHLTTGKLGHLWSMAHTLPDQHPPEFDRGYGSGQTDCDTEL